jgi:3-oxoacyl-[acyl-carrier protein] reductase
MRLAGKTALITGGASGFGAAIAACFIAEGARVAIMDINAPATQEMAGKLGNDCVGIVGDVTKSSDIQRATQTARDFGDVLDIVVNNAGWTHVNKPMLDVTENEFDRLYDINVKSIFHMTNAVVPMMRAQGHGNIINIGSTAGLRPRPGLTWYNSTKGAVNLLSKSMAVELATDNIRVNCVAPVMGATGLLEAFMGLPDTPENREKFIATIPMGRLSDPSDIAKACLYLASDDATFITGVVLEVDGGRTI